MNHSIAIGELVRDYAQDLVFTSEPESKRDHALRCMLVDTLKVKMSAIKGIEDFSIQGGSFVVRNTPWALATMNTRLLRRWVDDRAVAGRRAVDRAQGPGRSGTSVVPGSVWPSCRGEPSTR